MPNTPNRQYPYPALSAANDPPRDLQLLADAVDADVAALMTASPVPPVYEAGWGDYFPAGTGVDQYLGLVATRSAAGLVGLSGMFARIGTTIASTTAEQHIATLPEGYRPARRILMLMQFGSGPGRVDIHPDGRITARYTTAAAWNGSTGGGSSWVSLAGVSFVAAS